MKKPHNGTRGPKRRQTVGVTELDHSEIPNLFDFSYLDDEDFLIVSMKENAIFQSQNFVEGTSGWRISPDEIEIDRGIFRGSIEAADITATEITASNFVGTMTVSNSAFSGDVKSGPLFASNQETGFEDYSAANKRADTIYSELEDEGLAPLGWARLTEPVTISRSGESDVVAVSIRISIFAIGTRYRFWAATDGGDEYIVAEYSDADSIDNRISSHTPDFSVLGKTFRLTGIPDGTAPSTVGTVWVDTVAGFGTENGFLRIRRDV